MYEISKELSQGILKQVIAEAWQSYSSCKHLTVKDQERIANMRIEIKELLMSYLDLYNVDRDLMDCCTALLTKADILTFTHNPYNLHKLLLTFNAKKDVI